MQQWQERLAERMAETNLPDVVMRIAIDGGGSVNPALWYRAQSVWPSVVEAVTAESPEDLIPLWSCGTTHAFAGRDRFLMWNPENDEPEAVFETFAELVRALLTDLYEDEEDEEERSNIARMLLPADDVAAALIPEPR